MSSSGRRMQKSTDERVGQEWSWSVWVRLGPSVERFRERTKLTSTLTPDWEKCCLFAAGSNIVLASLAPPDESDEPDAEDEDGASKRR